MKVTEQIKSLPAKVKTQLRATLLLVCAIATFLVPAFGGGYNVIKNEPVTSSAGAIEDVDLLLVAASAFGEARKVVYASDNDAIQTFIDNTATIIGTKWQNIGLIVGAREALSGSTWSIYQAPITMSATEVANYNNSTIANAYNKYKAFGYAVQVLNKKAQKSKSTAAIFNKGLDAMSAAAIKLGSFGTKFLNDYNPGPVLLALYDSSYLSTYSSNKLVQIIVGNQVLKNIICLFGDKVGNTGLSFFVLINAVVAVISFACSLFLTLLGNRNIGDGVRHFIVRVVIGTAGIYVIANVMSVALGWVSDTVLNVGAAEDSEYVEKNLNIYDWYLTGFSLPTGLTLEINADGKFVFEPDTVRKINEHTYSRLVGTPSDEGMRDRMENYVQTGNVGTASFVTPSITTGSDDDGTTGESWATDAYYAILKNYAENKSSDEGGLLAGNDEDNSPLSGKHSVLYASQYFYMSTLSMSEANGGWSVRNYNSNSNYYGLNPISAFNLVRSDFSGGAITSTSTVYPKLAYVMFNAVTTHASSGSNNMNSLTRFIASFTLILASMKGLITIFTAGFGGMLSGGIKTATGSSHGFGQALGGVVAIILGIIGISVIMSMSLSLVDTIYGMCKDLIVGSEVVDAFLEPITDSLSEIPFGIGDVLASACNSIVNTILTLILSLTFPKLGGIPITVFAQYMADLPGRIAEKAQMIESMLMSGRSSAGGGLPGGKHGGGQNGRRAQQMAGQAFSNGARQAGQVISAGAAAVGSLAAASLSAAGKALNKKADRIGGKPDNPGISNWGDLSPEQQARAAEVAAKTEGWENMDEDARQAALRNAGVYDDNNADSGAAAGTVDGTDNENPEGVNDVNETETADGAPNESEDNPEGMDTEEPIDSAEPMDDNTDAPPVTDEDSVDKAAAADAQSDENAAVPVGADDVNDNIESFPDIREAGAEDSMNTGEQAGADNMGTSGTGTDSADTGNTGTADAGVSGVGNSAGGTTGGDGTTGSGTSGSGTTGAANSGTTGSGAGTSGSAGTESQHIEGGNAGGSSEGSSVTVNEGSNMQAGNQQLNTNVAQQNNMQAQNVDESRQLTNEESSNLENSSLDNRSSSSTTGMPDQASGSNGMGAQGIQGMQGVNAQASSANMNGSSHVMNQSSVHNTSQGTQNAVHNNSQTGGNSSMNTSANTQQNVANGGQSVNVNTRAQQNTNVNAAGDNSRTMNDSRTVNNGTSPTQQAAEAAARQPMNGGMGQQPHGQQSQNQTNPAAGQGMDGTSRSPYGKEMTIREQRQARALHAMGDALQMMGGNKSMRDGVKDALGYAKEAAEAYAVPIEIQDANAHPFLSTIHSRRKAYEKKRDQKSVNNR